MHSFELRLIYSSVSEENSFHQINLTPTKTMTQDSGSEGVILGHFRIIGAKCVGCRTSDIFIGNLVVQAGVINYFERQPKNAGERTACFEAMAICPTNAIEMTDQ